MGNAEKGIAGWEKDDLAALNGEVIRASPEVVNIGEKNLYFDTLKLPLRDETGAIIGLLGIARDITERIALQKNQEKERTMLLTLVNSLPDIVFAKDRGSRFLLANRATAEFLGAHDPADLIGKTDFELLPREVAERFISDDRLVIETGASQINKDEPAKSAAGELRWLLTTKVPLRDEAGQIRGLVGIGHDITLRKQAEQKLRQQTTLLDIASDAIVVRDMQNIIQYWNKSAEKVYGWTAEEAMGRSSVDLLSSPKHIEEVSLAMEAVMTNGEWSGEMHHESKAGQTLTIEARWTLVRNEAGAPSGILAVNTNVTEKRTLEAQLLRVQRLESLGTLAGGVAHDLNNVLTPILMGVEGLSLQHQDEHTRRILEIIRTATQRGANIVQQVLSFARGVTGERTVVQLKHALREVQNIIQETFPRSIEIRGTIDKNLWPVQGDVTQLHQVLMNLCVNARDAMPQGGILSLAADNIALDEAYARMNLEARPIRYVVLKVEDNGIGMAPEVLEKIFDPFFTTKEPGKGTGLGLSTTRSIVKTHQGFITVYSEVGKGSSFHVYIPAAGQGSQESGEKEEAEIPRGHGELILIVDDEEAVREITQQMLETYGYRALSAEDGTEAMAPCTWRTGARSA
jgi:two-component system cell cycle sensor histidine kinase/response regulator CckA